MDRQLLTYFKSFYYHNYDYKPEIMKWASAKTTLTNNSAIKMYRNIQRKSQLIKNTNLFCEDFVYPHQDIDVTNIETRSQYFLDEHFTNKACGPCQEYILTAVKFWNCWKTVMDFGCHGNASYWACCCLGALQTCWNHYAIHSCAMQFIYD